MRFILASNNKKKIAEMRELLADLGVEILSQSEAGIQMEIEETGSTFAENAYLKASSVAELSGCPAISDDSGLMVDALDGKPGGYSARYGGSAYKTDKDRYMLLLKNMEGIEDRSAKFVSAIACVFPNGDVIRAQGECNGEILTAPQGEGGFGYDPIFYLPEKGLSMAQLGEEKNKISHRAKALEEFKKELRKYYADK